MEKQKYFFSYARDDSEFVLQLAKKLRAAGVNLWLDQLDILGGQRWDRAVEDALRTCNGMILILSPEAVASNNVMDEVSYALEEGKLIVPVLCRDCDIPFRLRRVQYVDFSDDYDRGFRQLLTALGIRPSAPQEASEFSGKTFVKERGDEQPPVAGPPISPKASVAENKREQTAPKTPASPSLAKQRSARIRWLATAGMLVVFAASGFVVGNVVYESSRSSIAAWIGAVFTWLVGLRLTYRTLKRLK